MWLTKAHTSQEAPISTSGSSSRNSNYYPHLVIKGNTEYLGVCFIDGEEVIFDKEIIASALALYEGVDYSALIEGTQFMIMEGGNKVGEGVVNEIFQHIPAKEFKK